jgi:lipopolysaccharide biosynthesis regulator YciM
MACHKTGHLDMQSIVDEAEKALKLMDLGNKCLKEFQNKEAKAWTEHDVCFVSGEEAFLKAFQTLSGIMFKNNKELASVTDRLRFCYFKLKKYEDAVKFGEKHLAIIRSEFGENDVQVLNALRKIVGSQKYVLLNEKMNSRKKNEGKIHKIRQALVQNMDQVEAKIPHLLPLNSTDAQLFLDEIRLIRDSLFC